MQIPDFSRRSNEAEIMDDLDLGGDLMDQTLDQLALINRFLGGRLLLDGVKEALGETKPGEEYTVIDLGCGGGESLRQIADWGRQKGLTLILIGLDANPHVIRYASKKSSDYPEIEYLVRDIWSPSFMELEADLVTCSLFLHHFEATDIQRLIIQLKQICRKAIVVSDLQRHWLPWILFKVLTFVLGASKMIRFDGALSIRRGFSRQELNLMARESGWLGSIKWRWAFRFLMILKKG